jgi:rhodanese-related sulfurtransferase
LNPSLNGASSQECIGGGRDRPDLLLGITETHFMPTIEKGGTMMMSRRFSAIVALFLLFSLVISVAAFQGTPPTDPKKNTVLGKYVTAGEAHAMWQANPEGIKILDVRTPEEYVFVGHAPMAYNAPSKIWTGKLDAAKKDYVLEDTPQFEVRVKQLFSLDDTILVMCRSGHRSAPAVNRMAAIGFKNVYNITDGFEGDKVADQSSPSFGKRMLNGWRNSSVPWTYDLDPKLLSE